ncbi:hypothetical protein CWB73_00400 [Pseudoalteromonas phenolica]|uniref:HTH cro/C1-type domain-containing protein n=1 Tax=Pseudoalteromonas phenolica TaxID=161398 RepID=A0A5S3YYU2_9GAMM|nr:helix-turn-helix domain-containing protein [Pseudoalteromonas phenolica]TMP84162.1 hypothetical protein CWB73_00400 [Pseudoalteromonas phenolica]
MVVLRCNISSKAINKNKDMTQPSWLKKVKFLMKEKGVKQQDLMEVFGVSSQGAVSHYFSGRNKTSSEQLNALASFLSVDVEQLEDFDKLEEKVDSSLDVEALTEAFQTIARLDKLSEKELFDFFSVYEKMGLERIAEAYDVITKLNQKKKQELENQILKLKKA